MDSDGTDPGVALPLADLDSLRVFMPYEIRLAQRRAMGWGIAAEETLQHTSIGLYLLQAAGPREGPLPPDEDGGFELRAQLVAGARAALRDSDVLGVISGSELFAVVHDLEPHQSYVVAQRLLSATARSELLRGAGVSTRVGYLVYPLTTQPNFPPLQWTALVDLARAVSLRGISNTPKAPSGFGIMRGPAASDNDIPESDLVDLAFQDLDSLVGAGLLSLQRIHLMSGL
jgi:hypothetical protein